ncbi:MAG: site-specific DNA-methyltransferase [Bacteroidetes bacterium]|nr:site-specific DNA-methyltransferase [Bacteroidota bacterium]
MNKLFFGDCLDVLKDLHKKNPDGFIDLIYIDPPFNSKRNYNVLFESLDMADTKAQKEAFADTWSNVTYIDSLNEILEELKDKNLYTFLKTLDTVSESKSVVSYLTTMAIRIHYMRKVLKDTGSFYLHCDQTMSHYLKIICDFIFGINNFINEIIWKRTSSLKTSQFKNRKFGVNTDTLLLYAKTDKYFFDSEAIKVSFTKKELLEHYPFEDEKGRFAKSPLFRSVGMGERINLCYEYKNVSSPTKAGWKISIDKLKKLDVNGEIDWTNPKIPYRKFRPENTKGWLVSNIWTDIEQTGGKERLGYPTQKPEKLLERIIKASSKEGELVADFFCGCGTTISMANQLKRQWLGADISHLAIRLILKRLTDPYDEPTKMKIRSSIEINGFPKDIDSAKELAHTKVKGRLKFEEWIIEVMLGGVVNPQKNTEGYDGYITFPKSEKERGIILIEVKSGNVNLPQFQHFINTVKSNEADMGIFVCFEDEVTNNMQKKAKDEGKFIGFQLDKIKIITVEELFQGKEIKYPGYVENNTFKKNLIRNGQETYNDTLFKL